MDWPEFLPVSLQIGSSILKTAGEISKGNAYEAIGARKQALSEFEAKQLDLQGEADLAAAMRAQVNEQRQSTLVNSLTLARAAASGAGASDPTVLNIMAQTSGESAYRQALALYAGESQARVDRMRAAATRYSGDIASGDAGVAKSASSMNAVSTLFSGGEKLSSMYEKYWSKDQVDNGTDISG